MRPIDVFRDKKMKKINLKTNHLLALLAIALAPVLTFSSCALLSGSSSTDYRENYENYGYHFTAEAPGGQLLCYRYLNSKEVGCVTPKNYKDPVTGTSIEYKLSGDVVIPKTVSDGVNTYTVSALLATPVNGWKKKVFLWGGLCDVKNLVIPETVKIIEGWCMQSISQLGGNNVKNIIIYGPKNKDCFDIYFKRNSQEVIPITFVDPNTMESYSYTEKGLYGSLYFVFKNSMLKSTNYWKHIPQGVVFSKRELNETGNNNIINIADNYDIYAEGNSLEEYLKLANDEIRQQWMMSQSSFKDANFAVMNNQGARKGENRIMYFKITDDNNHFVKLLGIKSGYSGDTLVVPDYVTYHKTKYTVTAAEVHNGSKFTVIPETCKDVVFSCTNYKSIEPEIISYSPDVNIKGSYIKDDGSYNTYIYILHVPHGCVEKYKENAKIACLEIVDGYSVYEKGHSIKEYLSMSREAVEKARAEKIIADQKAEEARRQKEAAEWKAYRQELTKKYGAKYVNALFDKGQITIGMPIELFDVGLDKHLFTNPRVSYVELDSQTALGSCFRMFTISTNDFRSLFVGWVYFSNDKVSAVKY